MPRRLIASTALVLLALSGCRTDVTVGGPSSPRPGYPSSMAALGDSITAGSASCLTISACPANSWSTGTSPLVDSDYRRIAAMNPAMGRHAHNVAVPGATAAALLAQARAVVGMRVQYVTILIGANDACRSSATQMTPVTTFRAEMNAALTVLRHGLPGARILVVSIPDLNRLWQIGHVTPLIRRVWSAGICPSLLANPDSSAAVDVARRAAVRQRIDGYDAALAAACRAYGHLCRYDGGAVHSYPFTVTDLSPLDFFHPSIAGQAVLARVSYPGTFTW